MEEDGYFLEITIWDWSWGSTVRTNDIDFEMVCWCSVWSPVQTEEDKKIVLANGMDMGRHSVFWLKWSWRNLILQC